MSVSTEEKEVIHAMYTKTTFVKIKQSLEIGKILLSFVDMTSKKNIDCYMQAEEFGACLMQDIKNGSLFKKLAAEKAKGAQYPDKVWESPMGGTKKDGNMISRHFTISPGSKSEVLFTALQYPATQNETGAYIPIKGSQPFIIRVACTYNDLRILQYKWSYLEKDYMTSKYNIKAMTSEYQSRNNENKIPNSPNTQNDQKFMTNILIKGSGKIMSNGMKMFPITVGDTIGRLFIRPEDIQKVPDTEGAILTIPCERKGNDYLMIS